MDDVADAPGPGPHARFPWAPALLSATSIAVAAWIWVRYSCAWELEPDRLRSTDREGPAHLGFLTSSNHPALLERYVTVRNPHCSPAWGVMVFCYLRTGGVRAICLARLGCELPLERGLALRGRFVRLSTALRDGAPRPTHVASEDLLVLDTTAGRFHPASIGGIVVTATVTLIFALYLGRWLRRAARSLPAGGAGHAGPTRV